MSDEVLPADMCPVGPGAARELEHARKVREGEDCGCSPGYHDEEVKMPETSICCFIEETNINRGYSSPCEEKAVWVITFGPSPDDYTEACTEHVGALLPDSGEITLTQIGDIRDTAPVDSRFDPASMTVRQFLAISYGERPTMMDAEALWNRIIELGVEKDLVITALKEAIQVAGHSNLIGHYNFLAAVADPEKRKGLVEEMVKSKRLQRA